MICKPNKIEAYQQWVKIYHIIPTFFGLCFKCDVMLFGVQAQATPVDYHHEPCWRGALKGDLKMSLASGFWMCLILILSWYILAIHSNWVCFESWVPGYPWVPHSISLSSGPHQVYHGISSWKFPVSKYLIWTCVSRILLITIIFPWQMKFSSQVWPRG